MAADIAEFLKKKFMDEMEEAEEGFQELPPDHVIPLLPYFQQIRDILKQQPTSNITSCFRIMKRCLYDLTASLTDCIIFLEKRKMKMENKESTSSSSQEQKQGHYSLTELWFLWKTKKKLIRIKKNLLVISTSHHHTVVEDQTSLPAAIKNVAVTSPSSSSGSLSIVIPPRDDPYYQYNNYQLKGHVRQLANLVLDQPSKILDEEGFSKEIAIVGIGGCGKTTVARMLKDEKDFYRYFRLRIIWIHLGGVLKGEIDFKKILEAVLEPCRSWRIIMLDDDSVEGLLKAILETFRGEDFMLVFDGVWDISLDWYYRLKQSLRWPKESNQNGRRLIVIMITTRLDGVAKRMVGPNNLYRMPPFSGKDIWGLISNDKHEKFQPGFPPEHPIVLKMKDEIIYHSHGLLLSAITFNRLLTKHTFGPDTERVFHLGIKLKVEIYIAINARDDTKRGKDLLLSLPLLFDADRVLDMSPGAPQFEFSNFLMNISKEESPRCIIVILGGDATTNRFLQAVSDRELHSTPSIAVMPLGTQVNISISLGWGHQLSDTDSKPTSLFLKSYEAKEVLMDSWQFVMKTPILDNFEIPDTLHVQRIYEEDLLHMGGDLCGRFWNYFIIGLDSQDWFGSSHFKFWRRNIILPIRVKIKDHQNQWKTLNLPRSIRSIVCLNMPSFPGGLDPWGKPNFRRTKERNFTTSFVDDELLEIIGFRDSWHGEIFLPLNHRGTRLAQVHQIRFELYKGAAKNIYITFDGTRWRQSTPIDDDNYFIEISYFCKSKMLATSSSKCRHKVNDASQYTNSKVAIKSSRNITLNDNDNEDDDDNDNEDDDDNDNEDDDDDDDNP